MEQVDIKYKNVIGAHTAYVRSVDYYEYKQKTILSAGDGSFSADEILDGARRSLIQAFEIFVEVLWKYIKWVLTEVYQTEANVVVPKTIISKACEIRVLSETEARFLINLIGLRNQTSHIYKEELMCIITQKLCSAAPQLAEIVHKLDDKNLP